MVRNRAELMAVLLLLLLLLLATLIVPVIGSAASNTHRAMCQDSLRQLRIASAGYEADNDGGFPPSVISGEYRGIGRWQYWPEYIRDYVKDLRHFACPANKRRGAQAYEADDLLPTPFSLNYVSYGMNYFLGYNIANHDQMPYNVKRVANPNYVVYLGDALTLELRATSCWEMDHNPLHDGGANYLMVDGHVEWHDRRTLGLYTRQEGWKQDKKRWQDWTAK